MPEPPRREGRPFDAERVGVEFMLAILVMVAIAGLAFWAIGVLAGTIVALTMIAIALYLGLRLDRKGEVDVRRPVEDDTHRVLVLVASRPDPDRLGQVLGKHLSDSASQAVYVVIAAMTDAAHLAASDVDGAQASAQALLDETTSRLRRSSAKVDGTVGDSDPRMALEDALRVFPADEVVLVNAPDDHRDALQRSVAERADRDVPLRVTELEAG